MDDNLSDAEPYSVTEYCSGGNLYEIMEREGFDLHKDFRVFLDVCDGLSHAHDRKPKIIHRDIKPENILLREPEGPAIVADFGICYIDGADRRTSVQEKVGPRWFIAPELQDGRLEDIKPSSDFICLAKSSTGY